MMACERCGVQRHKLEFIDGQELCDDCVELYHRECVYGEDHGFGVRQDFLIPRKEAQQ